ncbi:uncharacterized protein LOC119067394 [Bradysia coprophila]|uniref:uncharacterized protein LOC119067394 n=1 Tax=Bradysia coprophila TaxID=38358 RepID=UPI00187D9D28|nr:uncharacterized protein LOC119067394 [Bradysia coprophila]
MSRLILLSVVALSSVTIHALTNNLMDLLYVDHIECKFNKNLCKNTICSTKFHNRTAKLVTLNCFTVVPFESIKIQSSLHYHFTGGYRQFAINIRSDWCKFMDGTDKSILLDVFLKYIDGYANFNRKCPLNGNYSVENLPMNAQLFGGQFLPAGNYYYQTIINVNGDHGITWRAYFNIPAGRTILDDAMGR